MNKNVKKQIRSNMTIKKICMIGTVALSILLITYLAVTISSTNKLNSQIKLTTEHPFVVSRYIGEVKADVAQMRVRTERLQSYNKPADIKKVRTALDELYNGIAFPVAEISRLYLGPKETADLLSNTVEQIREKQSRLLRYAAIEGRTKEQITLYEENELYPLYDLIDKISNDILAYTQNTQMTVYKSANEVFASTVAWSIVIVVATIAGLIVFQYVLTKLNEEITYKNQHFETLAKTIDETFMIFEMNKKTCDFVANNSLKVLGISSDDLTENRKIFYNYVDEYTKGEILSILSDDFKGKGKGKGNDKELKIKYVNPETHEQRWLLARFYRATGKGNHCQHIVTVSDQTNDINSRQALQDALINAQNADNAKRDFLSRMSHEIRTPINAIIGMTTIAGASIHDRTRVEDCLSKISYSSKHLLMLINDILDMSRIDSNKMSINNEPFDLYQFINTFVAIIYSQAQVKGVEFSEVMTGFTDNTTYVGDSLRLNQILLNLVSNAIKFTNHGGKVQLEVKRFASSDRKERIRFTLTDTGIGMNEDAVKRIYEPFEQADVTISQKYGGTGLGMSITKNLVSLMGGIIEVKSKKGEGTVCIVELPFDKSDAEIEILPLAELAALNVLVVDDEKDMCEHTAILLTKINIRAKWVLTGQEAIDTVVESMENNDAYDICFIDWKMPDMDGIETTRRIREQVGMDTPIIIISAYDWSEIEQDARAAGANAFISKPLFLSSVYNVLVNVTNGAFARASTKMQESKISLHNKNILVAEDNELNLEITEEILKMNGAIVECARDGKEAVEKFSNSIIGHFDAILMDVQMPIMNGYEATQTIRELDRDDAKRIPIIATTANAFSEDMSAAMMAGMNAHISKPIDMKSFCEVLSKFVN